MYSSWHSFVASVYYWVVQDILHWNLVWVFLSWFNTEIAVASWPGKKLPKTTLKSKILNSQYLGPKTVMNVYASHGKDCGIVLHYITLTSHSVQAQIPHFTNAQPRFCPDWASSGACSVYNGYVQDYYYTTWRVTSGIAIYAICSSMTALSSHPVPLCNLLGWSSTCIMSSSLSIL